jgi:hypothetical protein
MAIYTPGMTQHVARLCRRKKRHPTREAASAVKQMVVDQEQIDRGQYEAYRCEVCDGWHWGRSPWAEGGQ